MTQDSYSPAPMRLVTKMLQLSRLKTGELHYELGSGDARVVIAACRDFGAHSIGWEIDKELASKSAELLTSLSLEARVVNADWRECDFAANVITANFSAETSSEVAREFQARALPGARLALLDGDGEVSVCLRS